MKVDERGAPAAARSVGERERTHGRVALEHAMNDAAQRSGALTVDDPDVGKTCLLCGADVFLDDIGAIAGLERVEIELAGDRRDGDGVRGARVRSFSISVSVVPAHGQPGQFESTGTNGMMRLRSACGTRLSRIPATSSGR